MLTRYDWVRSGGSVTTAEAALLESTMANEKTDRLMRGGELLDSGLDGLREAVTSGPAPRYSRRLSDKVLIAFHHACDQADFEIAEQLLGLLETMLTRRPIVADGNRRRSMESLVAAHERLWHLRHGNAET